jgi:putative membrane protein
LRAGASSSTLSAVLDDGDPRVYFAAERTLLAWLRTAIAVMAFGFVVARFGLFLRLVEHQGVTPTTHHASPWVGAALVWIGVVACGGGAWQYWRYTRVLAPAQRPSGFTLSFSLGLAIALVVSGSLLGVILLP